MIPVRHPTPMNGSATGHRGLDTAGHKSEDAKCGYESDVRPLVGGNQETGECESVSDLYCPGSDVADEKDEALPENTQ